MPATAVLLCFSGYGYTERDFLTSQGVTHTQGKDIEVAVLVFSTEQATDLVQEHKMHIVMSQSPPFPIASLSVTCCLPVVLQSLFFTHPGHLAHLLHLAISREVHIPEHCLNASFQAEELVSWVLGLLRAPGKQTEALLMSPCPGRVPAQGKWVWSSPRAESSWLSGQAPRPSLSQKPWQGSDPGTHLGDHW